MSKQMRRKAQITSGRVVGKKMSGYVKAAIDSFLNSINSIISLNLLSGAGYLAAKKQYTPRFNCYDP